MGSNGSKIWVVDAVEWGEGYAAGDPLRNTGSWFQRHFTPPLPHCIRAEEFIQEGIPAKAEKIILSGSPRNAWEDDRFTQKLAERILEVKERGLWFLGVCYGHQMLARTLGGKVEKEKNGLEFGNATVLLTESGERCPLFEGLPSTLSVLQSHADAVTALPPGGVLLARGLHTHVQSFQHGSRMFGVQFHPETTPEILRYLWQPRIPRWQPMLPFDLTYRLASLSPAANAARILHHFAEL